MSPSFQCLSSTYSTPSLSRCQLTTVMFRDKVWIIILLSKMGSYKDSKVRKFLSKLIRILAVVNRSLLIRASKKRGMSKRKRLSKALQLIEMEFHLRLNRRRCFASMQYCSSNKCSSSNSTLHSNSTSFYLCNSSSNK